MIGFASHKPVDMLKLLNKIKIKIQCTAIIEQKLLYFSRFCYLMNYVAKYLKTPVETQSQKINIASIKEFFLRDACYFLCNIMANENGNIIFHY